ncbi:RES domain-containing protein [Parapedobacter sp. ISTM3]|uniref:RES domain-containing protein n=1 Tax=Parapedobacter luteus TaxID=623280 RepID=A0A1T5CCG6_9SPHI|nr:MULTISPECIES: RES domain-containing protein [Parapedobacter]MBK1439061.1 RES domain-containing protein [Parapedobacter sp. ISTM3]SKB57175.1 RES domain-containing protein [Parapedobacter luteus]
MKVYRLAARNYIMDMAGVGARLYGGRWNPKGLACLYTSEHISLALLEKFVHARGRENMTELMLLQIEIPEAAGRIYHADSSRLVDDWPDNVGYSQWLGAQILNEPSIVAFSVPSVIVPSERNVIINTQAVNFNALRFSKPEVFTMDSRLLDRL